MDNEVTLTGAQIRELNKIVDEHDPCDISIARTNLTGIVTFQYVVGNDREITQVLCNDDGVTMVLF